MLFKFSAPLLALAGLAVALPTAEDASAQAVEAPVAIAGTVLVTTYSGDTCNGNSENVFITNGGYRCFPVSNKRSIGVNGK